MEIVFKLFGKVHAGTALFIKVHYIFGTHFFVIGNNTVNFRGNHHGTTIEIDVAKTGVSI